jgi:molybdate transport system substrate-binding protein
LQLNLVWRTLVSLVVFISLGCDTHDDGSKKLLVFAAASLADALPEVIEIFEKREGVSIDISYGGSHALARQIDAGAPADLFISAGEVSLKKLIEDEDFYEEVPILSNRLVLAVRQDMDKEFSSITQLKESWVGRLAIADPGLSPAGRYAKEALESAGIWELIQSKLVIGADVRSVIVYLESGNVDAALVYASDITSRTRVDSFDIIPTATYGPIVYPAVILSSSDKGSLASSLLNFLQGRESMEIFRSHGFDTIVYGNKMY